MHSIARQKKQNSKRKRFYYRIKISELDKATLFNGFARRCRRPGEKLKKLRNGATVPKRVTPLERPLTEVSGILTDNYIRLTISAKFSAVWRRQWPDCNWLSTQPFRKKWQKFTKREQQSQWLTIGKAVL